MIKCGQIVEMMFDVLNAHNDADMQARVWRVMNYKYQELCREVSWSDLRCGTPVTLNFAAAADATGLWLPSDLIGIDLVWDDTNDREFMRVNKPDAQVDEWGYRFYTYLPSRADLYAGTDLILVKGASSFTSAALTAAGTSVNGEYVTFDDEMGLYAISSATTPFTFTPAYYGENKTQKPFSIRPWQCTHKLVIIDPDEAVIDDASVDVYYWRQPPPLYRTQDYIMLPSAEVLMLRTLRAIPEAKGRFSVSESMLSDAKAVAVKQNPVFNRVMSPRDKHGMRYDMGRHPFTTR